MPVGIPKYCAINPEHSWREKEAFREAEEYVVAE